MASVDVWLLDHVGLWSVVLMYFLMMYGALVGLLLLGEELRLLRVRWRRRHMRKLTLDYPVSDRRLTMR